METILAAAPAWIIFLTVVAYCAAVTWHYAEDELRRLGAEFVHNMRTIAHTLPRLIWAAITLAAVMVLHPKRALRAIREQ